MIILIKGQLASLDYFIDSMSKGRDDVKILDTGNEEECSRNLLEWDSGIGEDTLVITFNNIGLMIGKKDNGGTYWERKNVRIYNILVDHPVHYYKSFAFLHGRVRYWLVDRHHTDFVNECYNYPDVGFFPHGGTYLGEEAVNKDIDILYVGVSNPNICDIVEFGDLNSIVQDVKEFQDTCYRMYCEDERAQSMDVVRRYFKEKGISLDQAYELYINLAVHFAVERRVIREERQGIIAELANRGHNVEIHGGGWESLVEKYPENIKLGEFLTCEECIERTKRAKILLNIHQRFTDGGHERIFNAMLNGTVCVTNRSRYLEQRFEDMKDIIYIEHSDMDSTIHKIEKVLSDEVLYRSITENARKKVYDKDTWQKRLELLESEFEAEKGRYISV